MIKLINRTIFLVLLFCSCAKVIGQEEKMRLTYRNSIDVPLHDLQIEMNRSDSIIKVTVQSKSKNIGKFSNIKSDYTVGAKDYQKLRDKLDAFEKQNLAEDNRPLIIGYSCRIEFTSQTKHLNYFYSFPDFDTDERGLNIFLQLCKELMETSGFSSKYFFKDN